MIQNPFQCVGGVLQCPNCKSDRCHCTWRRYNGQLVQLMYCHNCRYQDISRDHDLLSSHALPMYALGEVVYITNAKNLVYEDKGLNNPIIVKSKIVARRVVGQAFVYNVKDVIDDFYERDICVSRDEARDQLVDMFILQIDEGCVL